MRASEPSHGVSGGYRLTGAHISSTVGSVTAVAPLQLSRRDARRLAVRAQLLDARRSELRNRRQALDVRSTQYQSTVLLIRALGGGWDVAGEAKAVAAPQVVATKAVAGG